MSTQTSVFAELEQALAQGGVEPVLTALEAHFRDAGRYHELFETLKMRVRHRAGLPLTYGETPDDLTDAQRDTLEDGLLAACKEVGLLLLRQGSIRDGWMYLRPVGDAQAAREALAKITADEANVEELVEVLLHEGVDVGRGFQLVLEHYGTCSSITTFETIVAQRSKPDRQRAAGLLVEQLHRELDHSLRSDIGRQEGREPVEQTIAELVAERDWLFGDFAYHIDTTHLASTMRFARILDDERLLRLALDMTAYGRRLSSQFQYRGDEPFADIYPSHALWFQAMLGEQVDEAVAYFQAKAQEVDVDQHGPAAREAFIDLLSRVGRHREALAAAISWIPEGGAAHVAPSLLELCQRAGDYRGLMERCREQPNVLGFATALLQSHLDRDSA